MSDLGNWLQLTTNVAYFRAAALYADSSKSVACFREQPEFKLDLCANPSA